jgi:hypothetical protein
MDWYTERINGLVHRKNEWIDTNQKMIGSLGRKKRTEHRAARTIGPLDRKNVWFFGPKE